MPCGACGRKPSGAVSKVRRAVAARLGVWATKRQVGRAKILVGLRERNWLAPGR